MRGSRYPEHCLEGRTRTLTLALQTTYPDRKGCGQRKTHWDPVKLGAQARAPQCLYSGCNWREEGRHREEIKAKSFRLLSSLGENGECKLGGAKQDGSEADQKKGEGQTWTTSTKTETLNLLLCLVREWKKKKLLLRKPKGSIIQWQEIWKAKEWWFWS